MVGLCILGVLMLVAVPSFNDAILSNKLSSMANSFSASAQIGRSEAIKRNSGVNSPNGPVRMCRSSDGATCATSGAWEQGWIIFDDRDGDSVLDTDETLIFKQDALARGFLLTGDSYSITFQGTGLTSSGTFKLCRNAPSVGTQDRSIGLSASGRVSITKTATGTCTSS
ncbi:MAG: GspH/FimT family pseudopilin [Burkholderiales bacterium]|nr:GspH/FimT family pseudopilin [Burkholderiales bacterium]